MTDYTLLHSGRSNSISTAVTGKPHATGQSFGQLSPSPRYVTQTRLLLRCTLSAGPAGHVLANLSARQSLDYQGSYCDESKARFMQVLALDPAGFTRYVSAQPGANGHGILVCQAQGPGLGTNGPDS